jgi:hypothetical protein
MAVAIKNSVLWDIKAQFVPHSIFLLRYKAQRVNIV